MVIPPKRQQLTNNHDSVCFVDCFERIQLCWSSTMEISDGKDLVRVELTFHKNQPTSRYDKKRAEWPRQPTAARRPPTTTRSTPARRQPTNEKETSPPAVQTLQTSALSTIRHQRKPHSRDHTITDHHTTNNTASSSRFAAFKEAKDQVAEVYKTTERILPCRSRE